MVVAEDGISAHADDDAHRSIQSPDSPALRDDDGARRGLLDDAVQIPGKGSWHSDGPMERKGMARRRRKEGKRGSSREVGCVCCEHGEIIHVRSKTPGCNWSTCTDEYLGARMSIHSQSYTEKRIEKLTGGHGS